MAKALSAPIIAVILLIVGVFSAYVFYSFSQKSISDIYPQNLTREYMNTRGCVDIVNVTTSKIIIKNCGLVPIKSGAVYIDGQKNTEFKQTINPQETASITISINPGTYRFIVVTDVSVSPAMEFLV